MLEIRRSWNYSSRAHGQIRAQIFMLLRLARAQIFMLLRLWTYCNYCICSTCNWSSFCNQHDWSILILAAGSFNSIKFIPHCSRDETQTGRDPDSKKEKWKEIIIEIKRGSLDLFLFPFVSFCFYVYSSHYSAFVFGVAVSAVSIILRSSRGFPPGGARSIWSD